MVEAGRNSFKSCQSASYQSANFGSVASPCNAVERKHVTVDAQHAKGKRAISVPLSARACSLLEAQLGQHADFVFTYNGKPVSDIKTAFIKACVRAGLGTVAVGAKGVRYEGFTWHGFRHTWATWHVQNGTPLDVLQKLGGWADLKMVQRYAHHSPGYLASFVNNSRRP